MPRQPDRQAFGSVDGLADHLHLAFPGMALTHTAEALILRMLLRWPVPVAGCPCRMPVP